MRNLPFMYLFFGWLHLAFRTFDLISIFTKNRIYDNHDGFIYPSNESMQVLHCRWPHSSWNGSRKMRSHVRQIYDGSIELLFCASNPTIARMINKSRCRWKQFLWTTAIINKKNVNEIFFLHLFSRRIVLSKTYFFEIFAEDNFLSLMAV